MYLLVKGMELFCFSGGGGRGGGEMITRENVMLNYKLILHSVCPAAMDWIKHNNVFVVKSTLNCFRFVDRFVILHFFLFIFLLSLFILALQGISAAMRSLTCKCCWTLIYPLIQMDCTHSTHQPVTIKTERSRGGSCNQDSNLRLFNS